jgi:hypothetical protein
VHEREDQEGRCLVDPDTAAEMLQIKERGLDLLRRCEDEPFIMKALQNVQVGFAPRDVAALYKLPFNVEEEEHQSVGEIHVWECRTARCRQKNRISTGTQQQTCPSCRQPMHHLMDVDHPDEVAHMLRTFVPDPHIQDPLHRTDRTRDSAPMSSLGDE